MPIQPSATPGPRDIPRPQWARALLPGLIFLVAFTAFGPALSAGFVDFDDGILLVENTRYRGFTPDNLAWMFSTTKMGHYQPLTWLSYAADVALSGPRLDPSQFHLTNMLLHAASAVLVYFLAWRLLGLSRLGTADPILPLAAAAAALLWAVHPLRVESVAWATERRDVLSGFLLLLTTLAYLRAVRPGAPGLLSARWYIASILMLTLSLLSKAWGMSFFVVALILDWYPLRRLPASPWHWFRRASAPVLLEKLPYAVLGAACAKTASVAQASTGATRSLAEWDIPSRIAQGIQGLLWYPAKTLWPTRLAALYELPRSLDPLSPKHLALAVIILAAAITVWLLRRRAPGLLAAALAYTVILLPVLGVFQAGDQLMADRYSYLAMIAPTIAAAGGLALLAQRRSRAIPIAAALAVILGTLSVATWRQTTVWENAMSLWAHAVRVRPESIMAHINYGSNLSSADRTAEATEHFRAATILRPDDGRGWHQLGIALRRQGDFIGSEHAYRQAAKYLPQAYLPLVNLGVLLTNDLDRPDEGLEMYREAVRSIESPRPGSRFTAKPYLVLGRALAIRGRPDEARQVLLKALNHPKAEPEVRDEARRLMREFGLLDQP